jgi:DNA-binding CsgD family transcriptional regulator
MAGVPRQGFGVRLVARRDELRTLTDALTRARSGDAGAVLLSGDAGVGKSRLLAELEARARDAGDVVLTGRCLDTAEAALPYLPFVEVIAQLAESRPDLVAAHPAVGRLLPGDPGWAKPSASDRELGQLQLFDAALGAINKLAAEQTVLLGIEDLQWADRSSRDLLAFLLSRLDGQRLLVVGTLRSDDLHRRHPLRPLLAELGRLPTVERLHLAPFGRSETEVFVRGLSAEPLPDDLVRSVVARSEGNAFMAEELVSACSDCVPAELAEILLARVERVSPPTQQVLRLASALGRRFAHARLAAAFPGTEEELDQALREAVAHNILVAEGRGDAYLFRHALLREAVYADLLPGERSRSHARIAAALARAYSPGTAAELAHHSMESHDLTSALAASVRAAQEADELGAPAEMLLHAERALRLWAAVAEPERVSGVDELTVTQWAAWAASASGEPDRAIALSRSAIELADQRGDRQAAADIRRWYATYLLTLDGNAQHAYDVAQEAWRLVADEKPSLVKAWAQAMLARAAHAVDDMTAARRIAAEAMETARAAAGAGPLPAVAADALITLAVVSAPQQGEVERACGRLREAIQLARQAKALGVELRARYNYGRLLLEFGRLPEALAEFDAGVDRAAQTGLTWSDYGLELRVSSVIGRFMAGDWDGAAAAAELTGEAVSGRVATRVAAAELLVMVGRGRFGDAERRLFLLEERHQLDTQVMRLLGLCGAEMESWRDRPEQASAWIERSLAWIRPVEPWHLGTVSLCAVGVAAYADQAQATRRAKNATAADHAVAAGEKLAAHAAETFARGHAGAKAIGPEGHAWMRLVVAEASRLRARADPAAWRAAVDAFSYGEDYRQAYARWRLAEALLAGGDRPARDEAADQLRRAAEVADRVGAGPLREAVGRLARRSRIVLADGSVRQNVPTQLFTPREQAVLRLVATGRTNKQIGEELFISEKTVSVHLSRVMAKLQVTSRTEAVSAAYAGGLLEVGDSRP